MINVARTSLNRFHLTISSAITLTCLLSAQSVLAAISFQQASGPFAKAEAWGSSWGDFNNDRCPDLFVNHHRDQAALYKNNCDGTFKDVSQKVDVDSSWLGSNHFSDQHGVAWADIDGDGDEDLYITTGARWDGVLLMNEGGVLRNRTEAAGLSNDREGRMPMWFDYNNNRALDLVIQARTRTWSLQQNSANLTFTDNSGSTGLNSGIAQDHGLLIDLDKDGSPEYIGVGEGTFPTIAYDTTTLPFRKITNNIPPVPLTVDTAIADFNGDQLNDILLVRGRIRRTQSMQFGPKLVETWITTSAGGPDKSIRFKSPGGNLQIAMYSFLGLVRYHFGATGYHPGASTRIDSTTYKFSLDASNSLNHGIKSHSSTAPDDLGIYIGYNPQSQEWEIDFANGSQYTTAYFVINSSAQISNLKVVGTGAIDKPIAPVILLNNGKGIDGNTIPLTVASQIGALSTPVRCNGVAAGDFDNDMDQDIYMACSGGVENIANILYQNRGNGQFDVVANAGGAAGPIGSSVTDRLGIADNVTIADYDGDGKLDMYVTNGAQLFPVRYDVPDQLYRNTTQNNNKWIELDLAGTQSNADGIGAKVYATAGGVTQLREQNGGHHRWAQNYQRLHFGLASNNTVDLRIVWPSGMIDNYSNVNANKLYRATEGKSLTAKSFGPVAPDPGQKSGADNVDVLRANYYSADKKLWVRATSDLQPLSSATLTVVATTNGTDKKLGTLSWNSTQKAYQSNFQNVLVSPDCVTVTSSGGGSDNLAVGTGSCDNNTTSNLSVEQAVYFADDQKLWVRADSNATPEGSAIIKATLVDDGSKTALGQLGWKSAQGYYQQSFSNISPTPDSVIITSNDGETASGDIKIQ